MPRPFAYNPSRDPIVGAEQVNDIAIGVDEQDYSGQPGGVVWWMGPEEDTHVVAGPVPAGNHPTPVGDVGTVEFWKSISLTDEAFMQLASELSGQYFQNVGDAFIWLRGNGYWTSLDLRLGTSIYAFGDFTSLMEPATGGIVKIAPNGSQDATWKTQAGFYSGEPTEASGYIPLGVIELADESLLVYGKHFEYNGINSGYLTRISQTDGELLNAYELSADNYIEQAITLPDDTVLLGGLFTTFKGGTADGLVRYNPLTDSIPFVWNGWNSVIQFGTTKFTDMKLVVWDNNGDEEWTVFIAGNFQTFSGNRRVVAVNAKTGHRSTKSLRASGATEFNNTVVKVFPTAYNEYIAIGNFTSYRSNSVAGFAKITWDQDTSTETVIGNTGTGFKFGGSTTNAIIHDAVRLTNGKIIVVGKFDSYNGVTCSGIIQLNSNGSLDAAYASVIPAGIIGYTVTLDTDERPLIHIDSDTYGIYSVYKLIKLAENGTYDTTFSQGKAFSHRGFPLANVGKGSIINQLYLNNAGDTVFAIGPVRVYNPASSISLGRVTTSYEQDTRFSTGTGFNGAVTAAFPDPLDGSLYVGGAFTSYNGTSLGGITKLGLGGSIDEAAIFDYGSGFSLNGGAARINAILVQSDGQILIGGAFDTYNGTPAYNIVRLNPDGTKESKTTFMFNTENAPGSGIFNDGPLVGEVFALAEDSNGNLAIGGQFTEMRGYNFTTSLIKTGPDGSETYLDGSVTGGIIYTVLYDATDRLIAGGNTSPKVVAYKTNGDNLYWTFNGIGGGDIVRTIKILTSGHILIGGKVEKGLIVYRSNRQVETNFYYNGDGFKKYNISTFNSTPGEVWDILENADGTFTVCGDFNEYSGSPAYGMLKLDINGDIPNSWNRYDFTIPTTGDTPIVRRMLKYTRV
jgi:hypothetical protein